MAQKLDDIVNGTFFERGVPLNRIFVALRTEPNGYARPLNENRVVKLLSEFDPKAVGIILLSMRNDGTFACIDGQHRCEAARRYGLTALDAYVYIDLSVEQEAGLYKKFGDYLKQTARDRFFASLAAHEPEATQIAQLLASRGLRVTKHPNNGGGVAAVEALLTLSRQHSPGILAETIYLLNDTFETEAAAYTGPFLGGTGQFLERFLREPKYSASRLMQRLKKLGPVGVERLSMNILALERCSKTAAIGKALLNVHDRGLAQEHRLGVWPERALSVQVKAAQRINMATIVTPASLKKRQEGAIKRALEVGCPSCHVPAGKLCINTDYIHMRRLRIAAERRRKAATQSVA